MEKTLSVATNDRVSNVQGFEFSKYKFGLTMDDDHDDLFLKMHKVIFFSVKVSLLS